jgi:hypothetical protein
MEKAWDVKGKIITKIKQYPKKLAKYKNKTASCKKTRKKSAQFTSSWTIWD